MSALWSGRFQSDSADALRAFSVDLAVDYELWPYDLAVNRAHARMLADNGIISTEDHMAIGAGLDEIENEFASDAFVFVPADEDIHMAVERRLTELAGKAGRCLHAARSRNDQVCADFRLWCRDAIDRLTTHVDDLAAVLCDQAERHRDVLAPGYTHLQRAQPLTLGHALLAHVEALDRDAARLCDARARNNVSPLGAGAMSTTTLPIDPHQTAEELGFSEVFGNSVDAVAARDFAAELLAAATICAMHVSRLAEEVVLWATSEFAVLHLDDAWATGSSMMPQKKNPDIAELARALPARVLGAFVSLVTLVKGLPMAYNRDLQEDKAATFAAIRRLDLGLVAMTGLMSTVRFDIARLAASAAEASAAATDLAEALVAAGVPFRDGHELIGKLVGNLDAQNRTLDSVTNAELAALHPALAGCAGEWLTAESCVQRRLLAGGPHPDAVGRAVTVAQARIATRRGALPVKERS